MPTTQVAVDPPPGIGEQHVSPAGHPLGTAPGVQATSTPLPDPLHWSVPEQTEMVVPAQSSASQVCGGWQVALGSHHSAPLPSTHSAVLRQPPTLVVTVGKRQQTSVLSAHAVGAPHVTTQSAVPLAWQVGSAPVLKSMQHTSPCEQSDVSQQGPPPDPEPDPALDPELDPTLDPTLDAWLEA